jgi:hypothetical protein
VEHYRAGAPAVEKTTPRRFSVPTVLFGNKSDLLSAKCRHALLSKFRKKSHFIGSALTGEDVEDAFHFITASALENSWPMT